jgi:hypothetical protein
MAAVVPVAVRGLPSVRVGVGTGAVEQGKTGRLRMGRGSSDVRHLTCGWLICGTYVWRVHMSGIQHQHSLRQGSQSLRMQLVRSGLDLFYC